MARSTMWSSAAGTSGLMADGETMINRVYHLDRGELREGEEIIHLTDREREMLRILAANPGETVPRAALTGERVEAAQGAGGEVDPLDQPELAHQRRAAQQRAPPAPLKAASISLPSSCVASARSSTNVCCGDFIRPR